MLTGPSRNSAGGAPRRVRQRGAQHPSKAASDKRNSSDMPAVARRGAAAVRARSSPASSGAGTPPAPLPGAVTRPKQRDTPSSGPKATPAPEKPPPADSTPSSPRIAASAGPSVAASSITTAECQDSPNQKPHAGRSDVMVVRDAPVPEPNDASPAQPVSGAIEAQVESKTRQPAATKQAAAAAAAHSKSPVTGRASDLPMSALLPAERRRPGSEHISTRSHERHEGPVMNPLQAKLWSPSADASPAAQLRQQSQPWTGGLLAAEPQPEQEAEADPGLRESLSADDARRSRSSSLRPAEMLTPGDKPDGAAKACQRRHSFEGAPFSEAVPMRWLLLAASRFLSRRSIEPACIIHGVKIATQFASHNWARTQVAMLSCHRSGPR